jgi:DNA-binding FadR family transcriptional regulator
MLRDQRPSDFLRYLASLNGEAGFDRLPSLSELSKELGVSVAGLREQMEVARALGLIEARPRTGIRRLPYSFFPAVQQSLAYALEIDRDHFRAFADLRNKIEAAYWREAARGLLDEDKHELRALVARAWEQLRGVPAHIPHSEHRQLHLLIYRRLDNPFVSGLLEAYWDAYEAVGMNVYADYAYLEQVWNYHQQMVDAICTGDFDQGFAALVAHKDLLFQKSQSDPG